MRSPFFPFQKGRAGLRDEIEVGDLAVGSSRGGRDAKAFFILVGGKQRIRHPNT